MKRWLSCLFGMAIFAVFCLGTAVAQTHSRAGTVVVPPTNVELPQDIGRRSHTNFLIFVPAQKGAKPYFGGTSPGGETPQSLSCVYQTWAGQGTGCPINGSYPKPSGGSNVIAIVDAYDYPTAQSDFDTFSKQFGLPLSTDPCANGQPCFSVVYAAGSPPRSNCGWAQEAALDIEWAHAMAPNAQIILVEAASNSNADLMQAVRVARDKVAAAGGGEVSMSWGGSESSTQTTYDSYFTGTNVTYFASSGDSGGKVSWPSSSPDVVSAGGTSVNRNSNGDFTDETVWSSAGGGPSKIEPVPGYQSSIYSLAQLLNGYRGTPDISFDADPYTGVSVYDSTFCQGMSGWLVFGGTSVSSPSLAGIANLSGNFSGNNGVQSSLYQNYSSVSKGGNSSYSGSFFDVTSGSAGNYAATSDWDFASGIGTLRGLGGLAASTSPSTSFSLSASAPSLSLTAGNTDSTISISVTPSGSYTGSVTLGVTSSLPTGMSVSFSPNPVNITGTSAVSSAMTVSTKTSTPAGTYSVTVQGSDGTLSSSVTVSVTVTSASTGGGFSLSDSDGGTITMAVGSSATDTITVTSQSGFSGSVSLSVSGLPKFANGNFSTNPVSVSSTVPGSSTLTIKTNKRVAPNGYPLTITGTDSSGTITTSIQVLLNIN